MGDPDCFSSEHSYDVDWTHTNAAMPREDPRPSQYPGESETDESSPMAGYSDDPETRREIHRATPYVPGSSAMKFVKIVCYPLAFAAVLAAGYFIGKSSGEKSGDSLTAARSSPESDFAPAEQSLGTEEDRMELLRASIGESSLTLEDVVQEADEWDEDEVPSFASTIDISQMSDTDKLLFTFMAKYPFARDFAVELIADDYTAEDEDVYARLDNSLEAMELYEVDYEPVPIDGHPFLFVGSVGAALTYEALMDDGITHMVVLSETAQCGRYEDDIEYLCAKRFHNDAESLKSLDKAVEFIEKARKKGGRVMSHCWYGITHSTTLVVAYLMAYEYMPMEEAIALVKKTRPIAEPYVSVLEKYKQEYLD